MWHYRTLRHFLAVVCLSGLALPLHADPPTLVWTGISPGQMIVSGSAYAVGVNLLNGQVGVSYTITITRNGGSFNSIVATNTGSLLVLPPKAVTPPDTGNVYVNYLATASGSGSYCASTAVKIYLPDNTPPSAPSGLVASDIRAIVNGSTLTAQFTVQWTASTENQLIDHYDVQLNGATVSTATSPGTATIYTFTGLAQGTTYTVAVRAVDWAGNVSSWSSPISVTTPVSDVTPPTKPGALTISGISSTGFVVAWGASTDNVGVQGYTAQVLQGGSVVSFQSLTSTTTSCLFSGLQSGTAYQVSVVAFDAAGNNSAAQTANVTTTGAPSGSQPGKPVGLAAPILMDTSVTISWSPAVDGHPVDHYVLNCNGANTVLGTDSSTGKALTYYCFTGLTASTAYTFKVEAVDPAGNTSPWSDTFCVTTMGPLVSLLQDPLDPSSPGSPLQVPAATAPGVVGTIGSTVTVDNHGSANLAIPLAIAPGRPALEPQLTLQYNSSAGNGPLGVGFSLSTGFPESITRGRSILARDGTVQGVTFSATDKFYLDGKRLLCVSGVYGQAGSTYRTEVDSFVTVSAFNLTSGTSIDYFVMTDKSGRQFSFGKFNGTIDGFQQGGGEAGGLAYAYALKQVTDTVGNFVTFTYQNLGGGEYVLSEIDYTGGSAIIPQSSAVFSYTSRKDQPKTYIANRSFEHRARLALITCKTAGGSVTTGAYLLTYEYSPYFGSSGNRVGLS